jgi:hypothetical protein
MRKRLWFVLFAVTFSFLWSGSALSADLPVIVPEFKKEAFYVRLKCPVPGEKLRNFTGGNKKGLVIDLGNPDLRGKIYTGPYPFEAGDSEYDYVRYGSMSDIKNGKGTLLIDGFFKPKNDSNNWRKGGDSTATTTVAYRLELFSGEISYGFFDGFVSFQRTESGVFKKLPTIIEGPFVTLVTSDNPKEIEVVWETDEPCSGEVWFGSKKFMGSQRNSKKHSVKISGLTPDASYPYYVRSTAKDGSSVSSKTYVMRTAPEKGEKDITFAYSSDSYIDFGGGERNMMGVNRHVLSGIAADIYRQGAEFFLFGGDLIYGMTPEQETFRREAKEWKRIMSGFWHTRSVYPGMGNHEQIFDFYGGMKACLPKTPYQTDSGEAVFASEFFNPKNGPQTSDPRRPPYKESVYSFQYGPALMISFNNSYWWNLCNREKKYGGSVLGYIFEDQLEWIENEVKKAENDSTVKFIFLYAHSPVFPYMDHVKDAMWHKGNNNPRAYVKNQKTGEVEPERLGILEIRERFWKALSNSSKVAAVFSSHEHGYHRTLIDKNTPIGVYPDDDTDKDGILDRYSANSNLKHGIWHIMCGGGGSPFNAEGTYETPWKAEKVSSHYGYVLIKTKGDKASMQFIGGPSGEALDKVDDLMRVK